MSDKYIYEFILTASVSGKVEATNYKEAVKKVIAASNKIREKISDAGISMKLEPDVVRRVNGKPSRG